MRERLISELKHYTNDDIEDYTLKDLLDMYNMLFNYEYYIKQIEEPCLPQTSSTVGYDWSIL